MGGWQFEVEYERARPGRKPRPLLNELFAKAERRLGFTVARGPQYAVLRESYEYLLAQRRSWKAVEGRLTFQFGDSAGCTHATATAFYHWVSRVITGLAFAEAPHLLAEYGIKVVLSPSRKKAIEQLLADGQILYDFRSKLYVAQRDGTKGVRLVGDMTDVEESALPPKARTEVRRLVASGECPCPVCKDLRTMLER